MRRLLLTAAIALTASTAGAQQMKCAPRDTIIRGLQGERFKEVKHITAIVHGPANRVLELWANSGTGTWIAVLTDTRGISCIAASGNGWTFENPEAPADDT